MKIQVTVIFEEITHKRLFIVYFDHEVKEFSSLEEAIDYGLSLLKDNSNDSINEYLNCFIDALNSRVVV